MNTTPLHFVGIAPVRETPGMNHLKDEGIPLLQRLSFEDTFKTRFETDAHFCTYVPISGGVIEPEAEWPRCNKNVLPQLREIGVDLHATMLVFDYDNPGHSQWDEGSLSVFFEQLETLSESWPTAWDWTLFYTTKNGARLVYALDKTAPVDVAERHHAWLVQQFTAKGLKVDPACSDWTRLFRLPWVVRDGKPSWNSTPPMQVIRQYDKRLCVEALGQAEPRFKRDTIIAPIIPLDLPMPDLDESRKLIETIEVGTFAPTMWYSTAKRILKGRDCYECVIGTAPLAEEGKRMNTLMKYVGSAIGMLKNVPETTPAHIFALFSLPVSELQPDSGTPNWFVELWKIILRLWAQEEAKAAGIATSTVAVEQQAEALFRTMARGMKKWCDSAVLEHSEAPADSTEFAALEEWLMRRLIVSTVKGFTILHPSGYYDSAELGRHEIIMRWRMLGMDAISPSRVPKENGAGFKDVTAEQLMNQHGFVVRDVQGRASLDGAIVERIDSGSPSLIYPLFSRSKILEAQAKYDHDVDQWLRHFFGENYAEGCDWIRWALAFEEGPIAALSIDGAGGAGKKMLVQGLAECLTMPKLAGPEDIVGNWQYGILESPFLVVNEGWPTAPGQGSPADKFRHYVGGDPITVQRRFMSPVLVRNPMRVIFTANNASVISGLTGARDLSPDDREALFTRIVHYRIGHRATDWLKARGGVNFTGREGRRWIAGDAGQASDYVIAKHFLWLYQQRTTPPGKDDRLLVQGGKNPEIMFDMRTNSGRAPVVLETVFKMLDSSYVARKDFGLSIEDNRVFVTTNAILEFANDHTVSRRAAGNLTKQQIVSCLKGLIARDHKDAFVLPSRQCLGRVRWHELDLDLLKSVADRDGVVCRRLNALHSAIEEKRVFNLTANDRMETIG